MPKRDVSQMKLSKIYPLLVQKVEKKGRQREEVDTAICWLLGWTTEQLSMLVTSEITYGEFFGKAPQVNPNYTKIKGAICGVKVETIEDPFMRLVRCLDKMVDDIANGKKLEL